MIALFDFRRNKRFFGFPSCGFGVKVPISIKPNPKLESSLYSFASLSKPAANPTGFLNFKPKTSVSKRLSFTSNNDLQILKKKGILEKKKQRFE